MAIKRFVSFLALFALFIIPSVAACASSGNPLLKTKNFTIYYGAANAKAIQKLSTYSTVVIEPYAFTKDQITQLKKSGTKVLGYVSVMELEAQNKAKVTDSDYYYYNGSKMQIPQWNTYIMDITNAHYRSVILTKVNEQVAQKGLDGVFLDTVGDIDDYFYDKPIDQTKIRGGYVALLKEMKAKYPSLLLMQNWGFDTIKTTSLPYIDAVLWEDFNSKVIAKDAWSQNWIKYFQSQKSTLKVFTVAPNTASQSFSQSKGFVSMVNKNDVYDKLK
ncbi:endo alpha-1,4 polygalactosaminidase [Ectobacillus sp. sgz5001026]|uniref:endo alpha-1,4 polygalactosaminidase n=1 Tax=Ectobacillus sp. sgz5001026 TaxID=3242473 RepID=UPI0036D2C48E